MSGALVAYGGNPTQAIIADNDRILVINNLGEVWSHNLSGNTVGAAYKMAGSLVAYGGSPTKSIFAEGGRILVINTQGEVWGSIPEWT